MQVLNIWDTLECYCKTNNTCVIYFTNEKIKTADDAKKAEVWTWYEEFTETAVLDAMKTLGEWDMIPVRNVDQAIANAIAWFPSKEDCPDEYHHWVCYIMGTDGDFEWKNMDSVPSNS
tara:strand:- start:3593 stop:3946 length:354 start_codon:yes stop_codon:yes gene_type:complete